MSTIDLNSLTLGQLKEIKALLGVRSCKVKAKPASGFWTESFEEEGPVIVRSYGAGVFFGYLSKKRDNEVLLLRCRRIWVWKGANTLSELARHGLLPEGSRVSERTAKHRVLDVIEIIDVTHEAMRVLESAVWSTK
jgi:hypothetical protein